MFLEADVLREGVVGGFPSILEGSRPNNFIPTVFDLNDKYVDEPDVLIFAPGTAGYFMQLGLKDFMQENFDQAEQLFRKVIALEPDHLEVYDYLGQICFKQKRYEEAELCFLKLLKLRPNEPMLRFKLADIYRTQNRWTEEEKIYSEILHHDSISNEAVI